jgi:hypothetical protein
MNARTDWEMALHSIAMTSSQLLTMIELSTVQFEQDEQEVRFEIDEISSTVKYLQKLTNQHQYLCTDDYYGDEAECEWDVQVNQ